MSSKINKAKIYRSTPTIYNPSDKDAFNSCHYDDVHHMEDARFNHHNHHPPPHHDPPQHDEQKHECLDFDKKMYRVNLNVIPVFILEIIAVGSLAALAYFLRCKDKFSVYQRGFNCGDKSISLPFKNESDTSIFDLTPKVLYTTCFAAPLGMVAIGEMGYFLFSKTKKVVRGGCIGCRLHLSTRRIIRFSGVFLFGFFVTSIITDVLKIATGRLRPYFLSVCNSTFCGQDTNIYVHPEDSTCNDSADDNDIRVSFPSYHASLSTYAAVFTMIYIHNILSSIKSSRLLRPSLEVTLTLLALLCGTVRVSTHHSHWEDVFFGFLLGISIAILLCISALNCFKERHHEENHTKCCSHRDVKKQDVATSPPPAPPFLLRYFRIPHVSYPNNKTGMTFPMDATEDFTAKPAINEAFQKDLHQRIEDFTKRQSYNT